MVDFQSHFRMYGHGYTSPDLRQPIPNRREYSHVTAQHLFKRRPTVKTVTFQEPHDCRVDTVKDVVDKRDWETWMLSHGLNATCRSVDDMHYKEYVDPLKKKPDKLLTTIGLRGSIDGDFIYPRGLFVNLDGDIIVADTGNHRVQIISNFGVFKKKFGEKGNGKGQFDEPTGVTELPNGDIAVADKNNRRIQVFSDSYAYKYEFPTRQKPYSITSDRQYRIIVSTLDRSIEVYERGGALMNNFRLEGNRRAGKAGFQICANDKNEVIICDPTDCYVKFYTYTGQLLYKFQPAANGEGLACIPSAICMTPLDQLIVADSLNHTVNLYTERGILLQQLLCPTDDAGCIQACALGPEGHIICSEFSIVGQHCLKIFRYRSCNCHATRPGSSKRRTPTTPI